MHVPDHGVFNPGAQESGWQVHRALLRVTRVHREVQLPLVDVKEETRSISSSDGARCNDEKLKCHGVGRHVPFRSREEVSG